MSIKYKGNIIVQMDFDSQNYENGLAMAGDNVKIRYKEEAKDYAFSCVFIL